MLRIILLTGLLLSSSLTYSQPKNDVDSLRQVLQRTDLSNEQRSLTYKLLGQRSLDIDPRLTITYIDSALTIEAASERVSPLMPSLYLVKGQAYRRQSIFGEALKVYDEGLKVAQQLDDKAGEAKIYMELATIAEMTGELVKALELNQKALDFHIAQKDTASIVTVYNNLGIIYMTKEDFDGALKYYRKAMELNDKLGNTLANARTINNIGLVFQKKNQLDSALTYYSIALGSLDVNKQKYGYALINNNIGICYRLQKRFDRALESFNIAKKLQAELNDLYGLGLVNYNIAQVYYQQSDYLKSLQSLNEAWTFAEKANSLSLLTDIAEYKAGVYEKLGDYRNAWLQQKQAQVFADSAQAKSLSKEMADMEVKYQVKQQQAEIDLLKSQNELHLATAKNKDLILLIIVGFSVLALTLLLLSYRALRNKQKANAIIKEKNEKLEHLNHEKNSLMAIVAHDLIAPLNSIGGIANILPNLGPLSRPQQEFLKVITDVVDSSRTLVKDVMDLSALENKELKVHVEPVSISSLMADCKAKYVSESIRKEIKLEIVEGQELAPVFTDKVHIDRILQNLVSNALKFSQAGSTVRLGASRENGTVTFFVSDEGPGISTEDQKLLFRKFMKLTARPTNGESSTGLGLSIVKGLVEELGGEIQVDSTVGKGTTFTCHIPVK